MVDHKLNVIQIITWDFEKNTEEKLKQIVMDQKSIAGYHVVKGMNTKMNYLID